MTYINKETRKIEKDILYYEAYRQNLKKFTFEMISEKPNMRLKYYKLLEEVDNMTIKIEALKVIKKSFEKYREI